jgi:hypothetical protein
MGVIPEPARTELSIIMSNDRDGVTKAWTSRPRVCVSLGVKLVERGTFATSEALYSADLNGPNFIDELRTSLDRYAKFREVRYLLLADYSLDIVATNAYLYSSLPEAILGMACHVRHNVADLPVAQNALQATLHRVVYTGDPYESPRTFGYGEKSLIGLVRCHRGIFKMMDHVASPENMDGDTSMRALNYASANTIDVVANVNLNLLMECTDNQYMERVRGYKQLRTLTSEYGETE